MPWKECNRMDERLKFVARLLDGEKMTTVCKDFGISRKLNNPDAKAMTSCGTPYFMPPEVCLGKPYDGKADVWAIGVVLYELIMLKKPFRGELVQNVLHQW